jgi:hypothetical protein
MLSVYFLAKFVGFVLGTWGGGGGGGGNLETGGEGGDSYFFAGLGLFYWLFYIGFNLFYIAF